MLTRRERLILLNLIPHLAPARVRKLFEHFGGVDGLWAADAATLKACGLNEDAVAQFTRIRGNDALLKEEFGAADRHGARIVTPEDAGYPDQLRSLPDPPLALYVKGELAQADATAVAVVGCRHASPYGLRAAAQLGYDLALYGITVVSGLARGIDSAAHRAALKAGGRSIAVLGSGMSRLYPPEHEALAADIGQSGAVVSEYPMLTEPLAFNFPRRNRIISGLSLGVVVVEAANRSGALITADCALEQGREVFAVPGPVSSANSHGTHRLLKQGARLVTGVEDILEELRLAPQPPAPQGVGSARAGEKPAGREQQLLSGLGGEPLELDAILLESGLGAAEAAAALLKLELAGLVRQLPGKRFVKA